MSILTIPVNRSIPEGVFFESLESRMKRHINHLVLHHQAQLIAFSKSLSNLDGALYCSVSGLPEADSAMHCCFRPLNWWEHYGVHMVGRHLAQQASDLVSKSTTRQEVVVVGLITNYYNGSHSAGCIHTLPL